MYIDILINKYKTLEKLLDNAHEIKQNKRRETIIKNKDKAIVSKKLVTLKKDVPIKISLKDFKLQEIDKDKLYKFLREMEFNRLLSSVISTYGEPKLSSQNIDNNAKEKQQTISKKNYYLIKDINEIDKWFRKLKKCENWQ